LSSKDFKEECWLLYGIRLEKFFPGINCYLGFRQYHSKGSSARVEMNFSKANSPWVIGWYHTHPGISNVTPSATDNSTMRSWVKSIYKTYLCGIGCGNYSAYYCYSVGGLRKDKSTIVKKSSVNFWSYGPFFICWLPN
jgi:hypothetical protein